VLGYPVSSAQRVKQTRTKRYEQEFDGHQSSARTVMTKLPQESFACPAPAAPISVPPGWGKDSLSEFFDAAQKNQFGTFVDKRDWSTRIANIDALFVTVSKKWVNPRDPLAALLFVRCHSAFRAASGLAFAGQLSEAYVMHRSCLEYAGYALHINRNPSLGHLWLNRHQDAQTIKKLKREFTIERVRRTITTCNRHAGERFDSLYQRAIDWGGHPNERAVTGSLQIEKQADRRLLNGILLHGDGPAKDLALKTTAQCGVCCFEIFQPVFNALFEILGVNAGLLALRQGL
jgi:hypothetical protein